MFKSLLSIYTALLGSTALCAWFSQSSINAYWEQTYHEESPLTKLNSYPLWTKGKELKDYIESYRLTLNSLYTDYNQQFVSLLNLPLPNENIESTENIPLPEQESTFSESPLKIENATSQVALEQPIELNKTVEISKEIQQPVKSEIASSSPLPEKKKINENYNKTKKVILEKGDKVFFAGDSLMQGVAPLVQKLLSSHYHINSINLSKQSTGLSYPSFFDWPKTIETTLRQDKQIKLLVVFLGPNDPWDFPNPEKRSKYLKFQTAEWEQVYRNRIQRILNIAKETNTQVIWLGVPLMKKKKLNQQMLYLEQVFHSELSSKVIFLPTAELLSQGSNHYVDSIMINGKSVRIRSKDGIHFSTGGVKYLADYIFKHIDYQAN
ncbi:hypothetical protein A4G19_14930 [Pasteurellaceae bacterium Macca]|nr:hypothetical protein [Pasteurellaceae bacterium Macca]